MKGVSTGKKTTSKLQQRKIDKYQGKDTNGTKDISSLKKALVVGAGTAAGVVLLGLLNSNKDRIKDAMSKYSISSNINKDVDDVLIRKNTELRQGEPSSQSVVIPQSQAPDQPKTSRRPIIISSRQATNQDPIVIHIIPG